MLRAALVLTLLLFATPASAAVTPYGTDDAGGFRNVLPPGAKGVDNTLDLAAFTASGTYPEHWIDQQPLYDGLLYASPTLTRAQVDDFYKDATFGVKDADVESTVTPRAGVTIVRDAGYGVPHVYGDTREDVMFGAGYAGAQDRLFLMDILRHTGRGELSSFAGGAAGNRAMDRTQWSLAPYTEADLQRQVDLADDVYGEEGKQLQTDVAEYVAGINAYIAEARMDPTKMPAEYVAFGKAGPEDWKVTDVIATASLIGGIFGKGGGNELRSALTLQTFEKRFGRRAGRKVWFDFRSKNDPEAPTTVDKQRFPYQTGSPFAKRGLALPDRGSVEFTPVAPPPGARAADTTSFGAALARSAEMPPHASNWEMVSAKHSKTGHPLGVLGPQVGYFVPQILMEEDLHGGGIDARGAAFPGVNLIVQLGHGTDYAWSATTADSDNVDTFAEVLCQDDFHYRYKGDCLAMEKLERSNSWSPSVGDMTPAGSETLTAYRTVHGIVYARGEVKGKPVAYSLARTTYFHEADSALGFFCLNQPGCVKDPASFRKAVGDINFGFNWAFINSKQTAYQQSGWYPRRAKGTSPDFPILGTGEFDWKGFDPELFTMQVLSNDERPHVVDQAVTVSWNGKQAKGWAAADNVYFWGPLQRQQMIQEHIRHDLRGGKKIALNQLVQAMEEPATQDIRGLYVVPVALKAMGKLDGELGAATKLLADWNRAGAHRRDLDKDGVYDDDAAVTLMDAWWPLLSQAVFQPSLGKKTVAALRGMVPYDAELEPGRSPSSPAFSTGWYGFVHKDLRQLFTPASVNGKWSRVHCGFGIRSRCKKALRASLAKALTVTKQELYGTGDCADDPDAQCFDLNRSTIASAIGIDPAPFQNRPTFQQTVELTGGVPR